MLLQSQSLQATRSDCSRHLKKMSKKKNQVVVQAQATPTTLIEQAISKGLDVDKMTKLFDLQERWEANQAKKAFDLAMAKLQSELPIIEKNKKGGETKSGQVAYMYAPLELIVEKVKKNIGDNGFSYSFKTENTPERVKVTCYVRHEAGHSEESTMETGLSTRTSVMSNPQQIAATVTFNKRYAFMNAFGVTVGGEDNDAQDTTGATSQIEEAKKRLSIGKTVKELTKIWNTLNKETRAEKEVIIFANKFKKKLQEKEFEEIDKGIKEMEKSKK